MVFKDQLASIYDIAECIHQQVPQHNLNDCIYSLFARFLRGDFHFLIFCPMDVLHMKSNKSTIRFKNKEIECHYESLGRYFYDMNEAMIMHSEDGTRTHIDYEKILDSDVEIGYYDDDEDLFFKIGKRHAELVKSNLNHESSNIHNENCRLGMALSKRILIHEEDFMRWVRLGRHRLYCEFYNFSLVDFNLFGDIWKDQPKAWDSICENAGLNLLDALKYYSDYDTWKEFCTGGNEYYWEFMCNAFIQHIEERRLKPVLTSGNIGNMQRQELDTQQMIYLLEAHHDALKNCLLGRSSLASDNVGRLRIYKIRHDDDNDNRWEKISDIVGKKVLDINRMSLAEQKNFLTTQGRINKTKLAQTVLEELPDDLRLGLEKPESLKKALEKHGILKKHLE